MLFIIIEPNFWYYFKYENTKFVLLLNLTILFIRKNNLMWITKMKYQ